MNTYLPIEVIQAIKVLTEYISSTKNSAIKVDWSGGIHLIEADGKTKKYISPIAIDLQQVRR